MKNEEFKGMRLCRSAFFILHSLLCTQKGLLTSTSTMANKCERLL
jgi:hypothetical protein